MFIEINEPGVSLACEDLAKQTGHFPRIVLFGNPFLDKEEIAKLVRLTRKSNPETIFEIYSNGIIRPVGLNPFDNIIYNVNVQLKNSGKQYDNRINIAVLSWYNLAGANFIFKILHKDDIDEANMIIDEIGIKKKQVFFSPSDKSFDAKLLKQTKVFGYNFALNTREMFWNVEGRGQNE